ncbi:uncharacterized protein LOC106639720 [Copidosoma floridanum]|uniref:uncharacterized protein LOC106639720 n=1 Tax=Copidosoma floridanum TaxID=29053 RepID=UPI0006C95D2D|nr:uncharacterized protein LOC106639720 [Copidosoma floridanum]
MGKPLHDGWKLGFRPIRNNSNVIEAAECNICQKRLKKFSKERLFGHRNKCDQYTENVNTMDSSEVEETERPRQPSSDGQVRPSVPLAEVFDNMIPDSPVQEASVNNRTQVAARAAGTARRSVESIDTSKNCLRKAEKDRALLKLSLLANLSFVFFSQPCFEEMLLTFDNSYPVPSEEDFRTMILHQVFNEMYGQRKKLSTSIIIGVQTILNGLSYLVVSFIIKQNEYFFLDVKECASDGTETTSLNKFVYCSIKIASDIYSSTIKYVLLESSLDFLDRIVIDNQEYRIIRTVSVIISDCL